MNQNTTDQQDFPTNKTELILLHTLKDFLSSTPPKKRKKKEKKEKEKGHFGGTHKSVFFWAKFRQIPTWKI